MSYLLSPAMWVGMGVPVVVLLLFPRVIATSALGAKAAETIVSVSDWRSLVGRCIGLALFVSGLGWASLYSFYILYSLARDHSLSSVFGPGLVALMNHIVVTGVQVLLGLVLAFGPVVRYNFRAR